MKDWCQICQEFKPRMKRDRESTLKFPLMEVARRHPSELPWTNSVPRAAASAGSSLPTLSVPAPISICSRKKHKSSKEL